LCALKSAHGGKARVGRLAGHIGEISTKTRQCGRDVVAVDTRQVVVPHQLLRVIAAVEIDIHTQQELVELGGSDACPRPIHDRDGPVGADEQVVGADIGV
jgi:hypothetical protein